MSTIFGDWNHAPITEGATWITTPVGQRCGECEEAIQEGDVGLMIPHPVHRECFALRTIGCDHGICPCTNFAGAKTFREAALMLHERVTSRWN